MESSSKIRAGAGIAVVALLLVAATWSLRQAQRPLPEIVQRTAVNDPDAARVARLERLVMQQQAQISQLLARGAGTARARPNPAKPTLAQQQQAVHEQRAELDRIERAWARDRMGGADAVAAENAIRAGFDADGVRDAGYQPDSAAVSCKAEMCVVSADFSGGADPSEWLMRLQMEAPGALSAVSAIALPGEGGKQQLMVYAARRGHESYLRDQQSPGKGAGQPRG